MKHPNFTFHDIEISIEPRIVRVESADALKTFLKGRGMKAARELSRVLHEEYEQRFEKELDITRNSLAMEIYMHVLVQKIALALKKITGERGLVKRALRSTAVIDCGEKIEDTNRFAWDFLSIFMRKNKNQ